MARPLIADIDLDALRHNYRLACSLAPDSRAVAVLKADGYGHGAVACARALEDLAPAFAVACIEEAVALREAGIATDRKSTRLNSSHVRISYAVFCLKKKKHRQRHN